MATARGVGVSAAVAWLALMTTVAVAQEPAGGEAAAPPDTTVIAARPVPDFWDTGVSGTAAALATPIMPGWGQLYAGNGWRGAVAFGLEWFYWSRLLANDRKAQRAREFSQTLEPGADRDFFANAAAEYWEQMRDYAWWSGGVLLIITLDAYVGANLYGFAEEPLPVPNRWDEHFPPDLPEPIGSHAGPTLTLWSWRVRF